MRSSTVLSLALRVCVVLLGLLVTATTVSSSTVLWVPQLKLSCNIKAESLL